MVLNKYIDFWLENCRSFCTSKLINQRNTTLMKFIYSLTETTKAAYHFFMRKEAKIKSFQKTSGLNSLIFVSNSILFAFFLKYKP